MAHFGLLFASDWAMAKARWENSKGSISNSVQTIQMSLAYRGLAGRESSRRHIFDCIFEAKILPCCIGKKKSL